MIIVVLGLLGLILGSFVNALVWRLRQQELASTKSQVSGVKSQKAISPKDLSILRGRSMCPECHHELAARDLVPVFSWLALRGRCRYCGKPISWQYPAVELLTALLFAVSYVAWPFLLNGVGLFQFVIWLIILVFFVALAAFDLRWFLLPDKLVFPLIGLAVVEVAGTIVWLQSWNALWEPAVGAIIIFGLFWGLFQVSGGNWIGGGDVKLAIALGLLAATPLRAFLVIFFASFIGTIVSIPLLGKGKAGLKLHIPFGPHLLLATVIVVLWGTSIVDWYQRLLQV